MTGYSAHRLRSRQDGLPLPLLLPIRGERDNCPCKSEEKKTAEIPFRGKSGRTKMQQARRRSLKIGVRQASRKIDSAVSQ